MLQQHMRGKHKKKAQLMCSRCKKTFREAEALERHQRDKHGFHIPDDGMRIPGNISLKAKGLSLCQVCGRLFTHEDDLEQHCRDKHANVDVTNASVLSPCQVCWRIFTQVDDLDEHYRDRHEKEDVKKTSSNAGLIDSAIPETITHAHSMNWGSLLKQKADNLTTYMEMHLQPTDECNDGISSIITEMLTYLQGYTKICRYIKAGCLGQGIHLLNSVDVKLLLFLEDFNSLEDMRHNLWTKIQGIKEHLLSSLKWNNEFDMEAITLYSLKLRSKPSANHLCTIELLPTCDVLGSHPSDEKKEEMFYKMLEENVSNWKFYSAVFTQLRVKFFQALPPRVRDLIRVVKHWKDCHLSAEISKAKNQTAPSSYALALITIDTWEEVGEPVTFSVVQGFKAVLQRLVDYESIDIEWYHNYSEDIAEKTRKNGLLSLSRPLIVDPGNPTLNVCADCNRWGEVATVAWESLQEPLLQGTVIKPDWTA
ncbi:2'-5'-oligoadenylate synthase 1A-like [Ptychodera flava]|uniref:2'-5'-oligoadenylate synthase 1A-like n=1 Tax=Ptychodera flava TaxID=63121 RepID=UPI00396A6C32